MKLKHRPRRGGALLLVAMRSLLLVFAMQFSGALHDISDFVEAVAAVPEGAEHEECPVDGPCNDCPPGCPNCHCAATVALVAVVTPALLSPEILASHAPASLYATQAPRGPDLPGLFRPPRA